MKKSGHRERRRNDRWEPIAYREGIDLTEELKRDCAERPSERLSAKNECRTRDKS
jgi:hypothetical protein